MDVEENDDTTEDAQNKRNGFEARLGWCYRNNATYVQLHANTKLVHGSIQGNGHPRIGHAWCVLIDGSVYDATLDQVWSWNEYREFFSAEVGVIFTRDEVYQALLTQKTWGPWER